MLFGGKKHELLAQIEQKVENPILFWAQFVALISVPLLVLWLYLWLFIYKFRPKSINSKVDESPNASLSEESLSEEGPGILQPPRIDFAEREGSDFDSCCTEILLHNVSHGDMVVSVKKTKETSSKSPLLCARPKFSNFRAISDEVLTAIGGKEKQNIKLERAEVVSYPVHHRNDLYRHDINEETDGNLIPVGFRLTSSKGLPVQTKDLRFAGAHSIKSKMEETSKIDAVFFPLVSLLVPKWLARMKAAGRDGKKIIYLISGVGTPMDQSARILDNSTYPAAKMLRYFIQKEYPDVKIIIVHSDTNLFRYDENISFVKNELLPLVESQRDQLAQKYKDDWKQRMHLTLSFADGSSARISAINASMRHYRPAYMHFWQLKTFWHENKVCEDDIECHSFEEISTIPATPTTREEILTCDRHGHVQLIIDEMKRFKADFDRLALMPSSEHDMSTFWLRKTKKPVLAVLLVQKQGNQPKLYRGTNMEVSMPTGSLCAERNVIGSALAGDITLRRQDIVGVAVLSAPGLKTTKSTTSSARCKCCTGSCGMETSDRSLSPLYTGLRQALSPVSPSKQSPIARQFSVSRDQPSPPATKSLTVDTNTEISPPSPSRLKFKSIRRMSSSNEPGEVRANITPTQNIGNVVETVAVSAEDMNPLHPCGACLEWLKKIAEVNPKVFVVTFTDQACKGMYIESVETLG
jgi:cytidine deaminase